MSLFETEVLTQSGDLTPIADLPGQWIDRLRERKQMRKLVLDMDSSVSETYGQQEGTAYNGHFGCTCYHPLSCFNQFGGIVAGYRDRGLPRTFRADAAFASPDVYEFLEAEGFGYAIRLPSNDVLQREVGPLRTYTAGCSRRRWVGVILTPNDPPASPDSNDYDSQVRAFR